MKQMSAYGVGGFTMIVDEILHISPCLCGRCPASLDLGADQDAAGAFNLNRICDGELKYG